jgi:hypothetical protein
MNGLKGRLERGLLALARIPAFSAICTTMATAWLRAGISEATIDQAFDTSGFYFHDAGVQTNGADDPAKQQNDTRIRLLDNLRTLPTRLDGLRSQPLNLWDISVVKRFAITGRVRLQLNLDLLNAFNRVQFGNPGPGSPPARSSDG